ncbi:response regulator [Alteromonas macleodii]|uniref:Response regulator n=1 Tax=Alteromonas macleodii TaxID=28108 RepID=A0AB36FKH6_ALTMA|nr:response regulator [Alteromonas macleodii]MDK2763423.1 response regulator [Alteromonas macleodii]OES24248.1 response regulator [Alteromonas macleodii]OES25279.1 response regulator [Alteromonas macleodii]OES25484.1 response regulator [Alteromonas macleodii]OES39041.1 response regulator [Alteromonas macleodii]|tara:strand:+ start:1641 stop:2084 length:444 start_codon:yes stop_codon:yes gene_type:complete
MKILLIEDSVDKRKNILASLKEFEDNFDVLTKESVRGALDALESESFDLILLDMSLPVFDVSDEIPDGGEAESFGGMEIIQQLSFLDINTPVVILTHYRTFHGGTTYEDLEQELIDEFPTIVKGMIYYDYPSNEWNIELNKYLRKLK